MSEGKSVFLDVKQGILLVRTTGPYRGTFIYLEGLVEFSRDFSHDDQIVCYDSAVCIEAISAMNGGNRGIKMIIGSGPHAGIPVVNGQIYAAEFTIDMPRSRMMYITPTKNNALNFYLGKKVKK